MLLCVSPENHKAIWQRERGEREMEIMKQRLRKIKNDEDRRRTKNGKRKEKSNPRSLL